MNILTKALCLAALTCSSAYAAEARNLPHLMMCTDPDAMEAKLAEYGEKPFLVADGVVRTMDESFISVKTIMFMNYELKTFTIVVTDGTSACVQSNGASFESWEAATQESEKL